MPLAVVTDNGGTRFDLKSCPGAFVVLRQMTYGEWQRRSDLVTRMTIESAGQSQGRRSRSGVRDLVQRVDAQSLEVSIYEFKTCVLDHNLEDANARKLQLGTRQDLERLDPRIGTEIGKLIDDMNNWDEEDEENFTTTQNGTSSQWTQEASKSETT